MIRSLPNRRTVLRSAGVSVALPLLESLCPARDKGDVTPPLRLAFVYAPNGKHMADWTPTTEGVKFDLPPTLRALEKVRKHVTVLSGLCLRNAAAGDDGPGDHARAMASFLTGVRPKKTSGADVRNGVSVDQVLASVRGRTTKFASLEVGCEGGRAAGPCDNGYSCAYQTNLSWRGESTPMPKEVDPQKVFERLFGDRVGAGTDPTKTKRDRDRRSVLDFVAEDARDLNRKLGGADRRKLDEYLTGVREVEQRIQKAQPKVAVGAELLVRPTGIPENYGDHARLLIDLVALAFRADLTRVVTFALGNDGSNRSYREVGVPEGHHDVSHHAGDRTKHDKLRAINRLHVEQFAHLVERLDATSEGTGTLLDRSLIVYGSGIRDGDRHDHDDLPILLAGGGNGTHQSGRHIRYPASTPLCNLHMSLLSRAGVRVDRFGDSTGHLPNLEG